MKQKGICEECGKEYEYEYNPKYPRKYCLECSAKKKQAYEDAQPVPVVKPGLVPKENNVVGTNKTASMYTSYAKDIFCVLAQRMTQDNVDLEQYTEKVMRLSTKLVKQAKEAFG